MAHVLHLCTCRCYLDAYTWLKAFPETLQGKKNTVLVAPHWRTCCYLDAVVAAISYDDVAAFFVKDKPLWIQKLTWVCSRTAPKAK